jgi:uroporphyrinogen-III synthase
MRVLVTRPQPDADELAARLRALGHEAIVSPLMDIRCRGLALPDPGQHAGLVATSRNALACLADAGNLAPLLALPLFAVGKATADAARALGFAEVLEGPGRASDLVDVIARRFEGRSGIRLWLGAAAEPAFDLAPPLAALGIELVVEIAYEAVDAAAFSAEAQAALAANGLDAVLLMSPRTAAVFARLLDSTGLASPIAGLRCLCLSANVAAALGTSHGMPVAIAATPRLDALLDLVDAPQRPVSGGNRPAAG